MNFQEKVFETAAQWRARARNLAESAFEAARDRRQIAARRIEGVRKSLVVLKNAGLELNQVARRHANRFAEENSPLISAARKDVSRLARTTFSALKQGTTAKSRKTGSRRNSTSATRRRAARTA